MERKTGHIRPRTHFTTFPALCSLGTTIKKMNIMLYWRGIETSEWWHIYIQSDFFLKPVMAMRKNFRPRHGIHFLYSQRLLFRLCSCFHSPWSLKKWAPQSSRLRRLSISNILSQNMMQPPYRSYWRHWDCTDEKSRSALKHAGCFSSFPFINLQHKSDGRLGVVYYSVPIIRNGPQTDNKSRKLRFCPFRTRVETWKLAFAVHCRILCHFLTEQCSTVTCGQINWKPDTV